MTTLGGISFRGSFALGDVWLFRDIAFDMPQGTWTCLLGPSGVGKTTILRLIAGLETGGRFDGRISGADKQAVTGRVAYMGQSDLLAPWLDVSDNVMLGARLRGDKPDRARAQRLIAQVGLAAHSNKRPAALSGGMRQRAALARTLMEDRPLVLLDEPFSALDARTRAQMQALAFDLLAGRTVLLVTHDPGEAARLGHQICILDETGFEIFPQPPVAPLRASDAPVTLQTQAALIQRLLGKPQTDAQASCALAAK